MSESRQTCSLGACSPCKQSGHAHLSLRVSTMGVRRSASSLAICAAQRREVSASARDRPLLFWHPQPPHEHCCRCASPHYVPDPHKRQCGLRKACKRCAPAPEMAHNEGGHLMARHKCPSAPQQHAPRGHQIRHLLEGHLRTSHAHAASEFTPSGAPHHRQAEQLMQPLEKEYC